MRTLILLRHAKSDWTGGEPDHRRPLANRGIRQAPEAGAWLAANIDRIDLALVSPATRARSTWELASAELPVSPETEFEDEVYGGTAGELARVVRRLPEDVETAVLVGHNPGLEDLVRLLTGEWVEMKTSAIAVVDVDGEWADVGPGATLRTAGRPPA